MKGELVVDSPARVRLADDLLGWRQPRPLAPAGLAPRLLSRIDAGLRPYREEIEEIASTRRRSTVLVTKTGLDRLACDGWALDPLPYEHTFANARGVLGHAAIAEDVLAGRHDDPGSLAMRTWRAEASRRPGDPRSLSAWLNALPPADAAALRSEVAHLVVAFREVWPPLPGDRVFTRVERPIDVPLADGFVTLRGVPDLVLDSPHRDDHARALVVDLKTGRPRSEHDRHELRFYALLVTLSEGRPPFRWGTFYVTEGRTEAEDLREETLAATARRVVDGVIQQIRLAAEPARLRIVAGAWCRYCLRSSDCETAARAGMRPGGES